MGIRIPNSRGHTQGVGKKEMTCVGQVQNFQVGSSNHILNSMGGGGGGSIGGVEGWGGVGGVRPHR